MQYQVEAGAGTPLFSKIDVKKPSLAGHSRKVNSIILKIYILVYTLIGGDIP